MSIPGFETAKVSSPPAICSRISDRVRHERKRLKLTQQEFAARCGIPLRTYKRFELGQRDSLITFIKIVVAFDRAIAIELLFPPKPTSLEVRTPTAVLDRLVQRVDGLKRDEDD
ncbi:helix-turn-helix transcriptional regulator [Ralstonia pseudosolanacearum]